MKARTLVNLRAGPGTNHPVVGALSSGQEVQVTGRAGDWLRIALQGGTAFVHGQFMVGVAGQKQTKRAGKNSPRNDRLDAEIATAVQRCKDAFRRHGELLVERNTTCGLANFKCKERYIGRFWSTLENKSVCCTNISSSSPRNMKSIEYLNSSCTFYKKKVVVNNCLQNLRAGQSPSKCLRLYR